MRRQLFLLLHLLAAPSFAQASARDALTIPLARFSEQIRAAGLRERAEGVRGVEIIVRGVHGADSVRVLTVLDSAFGSRVPVDSASRWLRFSFVVRALAADSVVVEFHEESFTRCRDGRIASHGAIRGQLFRRSTTGWNAPLDIEPGITGASLPCDYRSAPASRHLLPMAAVGIGLCEESVMTLAGSGRPAKPVAFDHSKPKHTLLA
jgi:hypothetical protein